MRIWLKRIGWGLAGLLVVGAIALAILLVPAHLQIRSIAPEPPTKAELQALMSAPDRPVAISYFVSSDQVADGNLLGHTTFVIEWEDGRVLLIDAGMSEGKAREFADRIAMLTGGGPARVHGTAASILGDEIGRVAGVGFTHLHEDHVEGLSGICEAADRPFSVVQTRDQATEHNYLTAPQARSIAHGECANPLVLAPDARMTSEFPGIGVYPLAGHTPGSTLFAIPVGDRLWLLTGDISNSREALIENQPKGFLYSYLFVPEDEDRLAQLRLLLTEFDEDERITAIVSHDANAIAASGMPEWQPPAADSAGD